MDTAIHSDPDQRHRSLDMISRFLLAASYTWDQSWQVLGVVISTVCLAVNE